MDINKILFEQLNNQGIQNIFSVEKSNAIDDVQKESIQEENTEIKEEESSALNTEDEDSNLVLEDTNSLSLNKT